MEDNDSTKSAPLVKTAGLVRKPSSERVAVTAAELSTLNGKVKFWQTKAESLQRQVDQLNAAVAKLRPGR